MLCVARWWIHSWRSWNKTSTKAKQAFGIFGFNTHTDLKDSKVLLFLGARHACLVVLFCLDIDVEHFWTSNYTVNFWSFHSLSTSFKHPPVWPAKQWNPTKLEHAQKIPEWFWCTQNITKHHKTCSPWNAKDLRIWSNDDRFVWTQFTNQVVWICLDHLLRTTSDSISTRACVPMYLVAFGRTPERELRNWPKMHAPGMHNRRFSK